MPTASTVRPRRRARRGEGERLREDILRATIDLLRETGDTNAVSIRAVAKRVGVTPPSIYLHFPDKRALLDAACEPVFADLERYFDEACIGIDDPLERLGAMGSAYVRFALDNREPFRIVFMSRCDDEALNTMTRADLEAQTAFRPVVQTVIEAQAAGILGPADPTAVAMRLWFAVHGVASLLISKPYFPWPPAEQMISEFVSMTGLGMLVQTRATGPSPEQFAWLNEALPPAPLFDAAAAATGVSNSVS